MKSSNKIFNSRKIGYILYRALFAALVFGLSGSCSSDKRADSQTACDDGGICQEGMFCVNGYCSPTIAEATSFVDGSTEDGSAIAPYDDRNEWLCENNQCSADQPACAGCMIGACYKPGLSNPTNACEVCYPAKSTTAWSPNSGAFCDDKKYCTQSDRCAANQCDGTPVDCSDKCDCTKDSCSETQAGCVNSSNCPAGKFCDCATNKCGQCGATQCIINGVCHNNGFANPTNACQVCDSSKNAKAWTLKGAGTPCGSATGNECASQNACDSAGKCVANPAKDGTACGDKTTTECHDPDTCINSQCISNFKAKDAKCGGETKVCEKQDYCDGSGKCVDRGYLVTGTACGNSGNICQPLQCNTNHECNAVKLPYGTQCGTIDQCTIKQCNANGKCNVQVTLDTTQCKPICNQGQTRCTNNNTQQQTCNSSGQWGTITNCTNGCSNGTCNQVECENGATRCNNNGVQTCINNKWGTVSNCEFGCSSNKCKEPECTGNATRCSSSTQQQTCSGGKWGTPSTCEFGCSSNKCKEPECTGSATRCSSSTQMQTCSGGKWGTPSTCEFGCSSNKCEEPECAGNATRCSSSTQQQTCSGGKWGTPSTCEFGCSGNECDPDSGNSRDGGN